VEHGADPHAGGRFAALIHYEHLLSRAFNTKKVAALEAYRCSTAR
jgi:hypothetical protein